MSNNSIYTKEFGPVLYALGDLSGKPKYRVLVCDICEPSCLFDDEPVKVTLLISLPTGNFWSFEFSVTPALETTEHTYTINTHSYRFSVPGINTEKLRIAYSSCNGSASETPAKKIVPGRNALWEHMHEMHKEESYHLLIQGGDQLYADSVWNDIPFLVEWKTLPRSKQYVAEMPQAVFDEIRNYYFTCYMTYWSRPHIREVLATIPSIMIWDDHDIFDGWGSWNKHYQSCPVYQGIFKAAREAFFLFQRGENVSLDLQTAGIVMTLSHSVFIAPDLRSERTRNQVMGKAGWSWFDKCLQDIDLDKKHLVLISSVPLATSHFSALDPFLTGFPSFLARRLPKRLNPKQFADDIHDQWRVPAHRDEWLRMLNTLLDFADRTQIQVTTVSGEIHLGARSTIKRNGTVIHQFIASGIAHPPAPPSVVWLCELLSKGVQDISDDIDIRMEYFFPSSKRKYLRARNWLSLELHISNEIASHWHAESQEAITFKT